MQLALFKGKPAFSAPLCVGAPIVEDEVRERFFRYMEGIFTRNYFTNNGPLVQELEERIARLHGAAHCVAVCNATVGQMIVLNALECRGEIILPSFTFIATAHACRWQGIGTSFCDIAPDTMTIDVRRAEELVTPDTAGVVGVHLFGNLCDIPGLTRLCRRHRLRLIFDAAHAFACSWGESPLGEFGDAVVLSFHATKFFGTFEGGAVLTNDASLAERLRFIRNFGFRGYDDVVSLGINGKMSEAAAAMGLASIPALASRIERLRKNFIAYRDRLGLIPGIEVLPVGRDGQSNYQYVVLLVDRERFGVPRDLLCRALWEENIHVRRYFYPCCHAMEPYATLYPGVRERMPVTEEMAQRVVCLPTGLAEPDEEIPMIVEVIREVHAHADEVARWASLHPEKMPR